MLPGPRPQFPRCPQSSPPPAPARSLTPPPPPAPPPTPTPVHPWSPPSPPSPARGPPVLTGGRWREALDGCQWFMPERLVSCLYSTGPGWPRPLSPRWRLSQILLVQMLASRWSSQQSPLVHTRPGLWSKLNWLLVRPGEHFLIFVEPGCPRYMEFPKIGFPH